MNIPQEIMDKIEQDLIDLWLPIGRKFSDMTRRGHHLNAVKINSEQFYSLVNEFRNCVKGYMQTTGYSLRDAEVQELKNNVVGCVKKCNEQFEQLQQKEQELQENKR